MCINDCMYICVRCVSLEEGTESLGTGVRNGFEPLCGCWELNLVSGQEQQELLAAEPSLQPNVVLYKLDYHKTGHSRKRCWVMTSSTVIQRHIYNTTHNFITQTCALNYTTL